MSVNNIEVNTLIAQTGLEAMFNKLQFFRLVDRQLDSQWAKDSNGYTPGMSYTIMREARLKASAGVNIGASASSGDGLTYETQSYTEDPIQFRLEEDDQAKIALQFSTQEKTLELSKGQESNIGTNAGKTMAGFLEKKVISETVAKSGGNIVLSADMKVSDVLAAQARLDELAVPTDGRSFLLPPVVMAQLSKEHQTLFTPELNKDIAVSGYIKEYAGSKMFSYNLLPKYTALTTAAVLSVTSVSADETDAAIVTIESDIDVTLPVGTLLEFDGRHMVNPESGDSTGVKYSFAITAELDLTAGVGQAISIDAAAKIYGPLDKGNRQNIDVYPAAGDVINLVGGKTGTTYHQALMFQEGAYTATCIKLSTDLPGASANRSELKSGFSVRACSQVNIGSGAVITRFDAMAKGILQRDTFAVRILIPA